MATSNSHSKEVQKSTLQLIADKKKAKAAPVNGEAVAKGSPQAVQYLSVIAENTSVTNTHLKALYGQQTKILEQVENNFSAITELAAAITALKPTPRKRAPVAKKAVQPDSESEDEPAPKPKRKRAPAKPKDPAAKPRGRAAAAKRNKTKNDDTTDDDDTLHVAMTPVASTTVTQEPALYDTNEDESGEEEEEDDDDEDLTLS